MKIIKSLLVVALLACNVQAACLFPYRYIQINDDVYSVNLTNTGIVNNGCDNVRVYEYQQPNNPGDPDYNCQFDNPWTPCGDWYAWGGGWNCTDETIIRELGFGSGNVYVTYIVISDDFSESYGVYELEYYEGSNLNASYLRDWYNLTFKNEEFNTPFEFNDHAAAWGEFICPHNGTNIIPLSNDNQTIGFGTYEPFILRVTADGGLQTRSRQFNKAKGNNDYYLLNTSGNIYHFTRVDYTGIFGNSTLQIQREISGSTATIFLDGFGLENDLDVSLLNNTAYRFILDSNQGSIRDYGYIILQADDLTKNIIVSTANYSSISNAYTGLTPGFTQDYDTGSVGATVLSDVSVTVTLNISNATGSSYSNLYNAQDTGTNVSISQVLGNPNEPVYLELTITHPTHGNIYFKRLMILTNESNPIGGAFNPQLPADNMGFTSDLVKILIALSFTTIVFYAACKARDHGTGSLLGVGSFGFWWYVNFIPHSMVPFWIIPIFGLLAFSIKMFERRII